MTAVNGNGAITYKGNTKSESTEKKQQFIFWHVFSFNKTWKIMFIM